MNINSEDIESAHILPTHLEYGLQKTVGPTYHSDVQVSAECLNTKYGNLKRCSLF